MRIRLKADQWAHRDGIQNVDEYEYSPVLASRDDIQANSGVSATKTWKQAAKVKPETAIPDALQVQVQKR